jgi:aryl-alcohol dehydrogenase-like predicted oxidoreductase
MKLGLGTVQFGADYGISNARGQVAPGEVAEILQAAAAAGVSVLDTAHAYGESEAVLGCALWQGHPFRIVTKTEPLHGSGVEVGELSQVRETFLRSLERLRLPRVDALMLHHASELLRPGGEALAQLCMKLKSEGLAAKIGFSCYTPSELDAASAVLAPDIVQLPCNLLDRRFLQDGRCAALKAREVEIHARSIFLQGLLLMPTYTLPPQFHGHKDVFERIDRYAQANGLTRLELALGFAQSLDEIDVGVVGVTTALELRQIVDALNKMSARALDYSGFDTAADDLVNPSTWTQRKSVAVQ